MPKKILLVEDEALIAMTETLILKKEGYEVVTVNTGEKAVDAVDSDSSISLILMDIDLGQGIDGTEAAEKILLTHDLPIVFLSSHTEPEVVEKTEGITSYGYIVKNSGVTVLLASIRMAFRLWESEDKFRKAFDYTSVGMVLTSPTGELLRVNKAFASMLGYTPAEIVSVNFSELTHPEDIETSITPLQSMIQGKSDHSRFTKRYIRKNGTIVWADVDIMLLRDSDGKPLHFITHAQDITESRIMQDTLDQQRKQYDLLLRSTPTPILVVQGGKYVYSNPCAAELLGYASPKELIDTPIERTISGDSMGNIKKRLERLDQGHKNHAEEITVLRKDGRPLCCESTSIPITFNSSPAALIISHDLTAQKVAEKNLRNNEAMYRNLMENSIDAVYLLSRRGDILEVNHAACKMLGYSRDELLQLTIDDVDPNYPSRQFIKFWNEKPESTTVLFDTIHRHKEGKEIPVEVNGIFFILDGRKYLFGVARDITQRKQVGMKLRESEEIFRQMFSKHHAIMLLIDPDTGKIVNANASASRYYGFSVDELCQITIQQINTMPAEEVAYERTLAAKEKRNHFFFTHRLSNGEMREVEVHSTLIEVAEKKVLFSIVHDITERKEAEKAVQESEENFRKLFDLTPDAALLADAKTGKIVNANNVAEDLFGIPLDKLIGMNHTELYSKEMRQQADVEFKRGPELLRKPFPPLEMIIETPSGVKKRVELRASALHMDNKLHLLGTFRDITECKRAEEAIQESNLRLTTVIDSIDAVVYISDMETYETIFINESGRKVFGDIVGQKCWKALQGQDRPCSFCTNDRLVDKDGNPTGVFAWEHYYTINGRWYDCRDSAVQWHDGRIVRIEVATDITDRKQAEKALKKSEERFKTIFDNSEVSLWEEDYSKVREMLDSLKEEGVSDFYRYFENNTGAVWNLAGQFHVNDVNDATLHLYGAKKKEELLGPLGNILYRGENAWQIYMNELVAIAENRRHASGEMKAKTFYGTVIDIAVNMYISKEKDIVILALNDITSYKKALAEKDSLMQELNHRVKNNLAMVSSLINLKSPETGSDLSDIQHQIEAIGLIHKKLYQTGNFTEISCREYFDDLLTSIFSSFTTRDVSIKNEGEDISVPTKTAISLGLIINEIATNAIKHGFNQKEEAVFSLKMEKNRERTKHELTLSNSGNAFPENIDVENSDTLGLRLISALVTQIDGTLELQKEPQPVFTIRFPVE